MKNAIGNERYQHYTNAQLLEAFAEGYTRLNAAIQNLSLDDLRAKPISGKWSIMEILIHLTDSELIGACRFRLVLSDFKGNLPFYNQDEFALKLRYNEQSEKTLHDNLALFGANRKISLTLFQQCSESDWHKTGVHPERGTMTLRALLELYADHSERHLEQILALRKKLNKPIDLPILLKERLY